MTNVRHVVRTTSKIKRLKVNQRNGSYFKYTDNNVVSDINKTMHWIEDNITKSLKHTLLSYTKRG